MTDIGAQYPQPDPRGWLVFESLPYGLQLAEDSTQVADSERSGNRPRGFEREATPTERILLTHLGYELPDALTTHVSYETTSVRNRTWPQLETTQEVTP